MEPARPKRSLLERARGFLRWLPYKIGYERGPRVMSELRKAWVLLRHPHATVRFGKGVYLGPGFSLDIRGAGAFIVGDYVEFRRNFRAEIAGDGRIEIGSYSYLTYDVIMACSTTIEVGERCGLAQATFVADGNHRYRDLDRPFLSQGYDVAPLRIEDDAQIHAKCTIVASIGRRAVIGANAVVTRPIPPYTLAVGVPARPIDYFGPPGEEPAELGAGSSSAG
jgi:acetyltransferase-like isoleucine patch superfamily enzyme